MEGFLILGVILCVALSVCSHGPTLQPYPTVFSALVSETTYVLQQKITVTRNVFLDLPNKRARINYATNRGHENWILIYKPQGGDPTSPATQGYTLFRITPNSCMYMSNSMLTAPFPDHWNKDDFGYQLEVGTWFDLPADLTYTGEYCIPDLHVLSDRWDTTQTCDLVQSGGNQVPCESVMFSRDQNPLPLADILAFTTSNRFGESDSYVVRTYLSLNTTVQDSDFALPDNWQVKCGNVDNNFETQPSKPVTVYSNGEQSAPLTIKLASPPVAALGDVKVFLVTKPYWEENCVDCVSLSPNPLIFNQNNWNVPQPVPMKFNNTGCTGFNIKATGGGYNFVYWTNIFGVISCEGTKSGCTNDPQCE